jgi:hypothetical protein
MRVGIFLCLISFGLLSCNKSGGTTPALTPTNLVVNATVNPDNSGNVSFASSATNAVSYEYDFGNGIFSRKLSKSENTGKVAFLLNVKKEKKFQVKKKSKISKNELKKLMNKS